MQYDRIDFAQNGAIRSRDNGNPYAAAPIAPAALGSRSRHCIRAADMIVVELGIASRGRRGRALHAAGRRLISACETSR